MVWKRPENVPFPSVWLRFVGKRPLANGKIPKFKVQDIPEELEDDVIELMVEYFARDEPTCKSNDFINCPESMKRMIEYWRKCLNDKVAVVCLFDEEVKPGEKPQIVGANMNCIIHRNSETEDEQEQPKPWRNALGAVMTATEMGNIFHRYDFDEYLAAYGLSVRRDFRGQNIGAEILKARIPLCKALGISLTATVFTGISSQVLAKKAGFKTIAEVKYKDLEERHGFEYPNIPEVSTKMMVLDITKV